MRGFRSKHRFGVEHETLIESIRPPLYWIWNDGPAKSRRKFIFVILVNPGLCPGQGIESSKFIPLLAGLEPALAEVKVLVSFFQAVRLAEGLGGRS